MYAPHTREALSKVVIPGLVNEIFKFVRPTYLTDAKIGELNGLKEDIACIMDPDSGLAGACSGGHLELAELLISRGAKNYNGGLACACANNHQDLVNLMIAKGAYYCPHCSDVKHALL